MIGKLMFLGYGLMSFGVGVFGIAMELHSQGYMIFGIILSIFGALAMIYEEVVDRIVYRGFYG